MILLFAPPSLLLFKFLLFFTLVYVIFYYDSTFYYGLSSRKFCMTLCSYVYHLLCIIIIVYTQLQVYKLAYCIIFEC